MRLLHTADWHAGRLWKNQNRLPELQDIFEHLGDFIERERIDRDPLELSSRSGWRQGSDLPKSTDHARRPPATTDARPCGLLNVFEDL